MSVVWVTANIMKKALVKGDNQLLCITCCCMTAVMAIQSLNTVNFAYTF